MAPRRTKSICSLPLEPLAIASITALVKVGLQMGTVRNLLLAWVLTLPASITLAAGLFWAFSHIGSTLSKSQFSAGSATYAVAGLLSCIVQIRCERF